MCILYAYRYESNFHTHKGERSLILQFTNAIVTNSKATLMISKEQVDSIKAEENLDNLCSFAVSLDRITSLLWYKLGNGFSKKTFPSSVSAILKARAVLSASIAKNAEIESGAGEVIIRDSEFEKLKLDGGIGKLSITSKITNNADIDSGVGKVEVNLIGNKEDYKIRAETGLGNLLVDGNSVANNQTVYDGNVTIDVEAGV